MDHKALMAHNLRQGLRVMRLAHLRDNALYTQWAYLALHGIGLEWNAHEPR